MPRVRPATKSRNHGAAATWRPKADYVVFLRTVSGRNTLLTTNPRCLQFHECGNLAPLKDSNSCHSPQTSALWAPCGSAARKLHVVTPSRGR